ncbi:MAG: hypothetical protein R3B13_29995 [Polyangiaceae bacterium]
MSSLRRTPPKRRGGTKPKLKNLFVIALGPVCAIVTGCTLLNSTDDIASGAPVVTDGGADANQDSAVEAAACGSGTTDCLGTCVDTSSSLDHCGGCDKPCALRGSKMVCAAGQCQFDSCLPDFDDCNGSQKDGCEANLPADAKNCGACGKVCPVGAANTLAVCQGSKCDVACSPGWLDCGGAADGCETDGSQDSKNCGTCGHDCLAGSCQAGVCQPFILATGQSDVTGLIADGNTVYWSYGGSGAGGVRQAPANGSGTPSSLTTTLTKPGRLALDSTNVYAAAVDSGLGAVLKIFRADGTVDVLAEMAGAARPPAPTYDQGYVYFVDSGRTWGDLEYRHVSELQLQHLGSRRGLRFRERQGH